MTMHGSPHTQVRARDVEAMMKGGSTSSSDGAPASSYAMFTFTGQVGILVERFHRLRGASVDPLILLTGLSFGSGTWTQV